MFILCSIDATDEPSDGPIMGRLVNHGRPKEINAKMVITEVNGEPCMALYALKEIVSGQEILYDYGVRPLPWEMKTVSQISDYVKGVFCDPHFFLH